MKQFHVMCHASTRRADHALVGNYMMLATKLVRQLEHSTPVRGLLGRYSHVGVDHLECLVLDLVEVGYRIVKVCALDQLRLFHVVTSRVPLWLEVHSIADQIAQRFGHIEIGLDEVKQMNRARLDSIVLRVAGIEFAAELKFGFFSRNLLK